MSLRDFVISFFAMVKQSSFACLGQGHTGLTLGSAGPSFLFLLASPLMGGKANMLICLARLRHIWEHMISHRRRELRLHRARHLRASALTRAGKH